MKRRQKKDSERKQQTNPHSDARVDAEIEKDERDQQQGEPLDPFAENRQLRRGLDRLTRQIESSSSMSLLDRFSRGDFRNRPEASSDKKAAEEGTKEGVGSTAQQVLALYYLLKAAGLPAGSVNQTDIARFMRFLTGRNQNNLYKRVLDFPANPDQCDPKDLDVVRLQLSQLGLSEIVK